MSLPTWLPTLFKVTPWESNTYDLLYDVFHKSFILSRPLFKGIRVTASNKIVDCREESFWHITTRLDKSKGDRLTDFRRCERLPWLKPLIENSDDTEVLSWEYTEGDGITKIYIWLKNYDYITILKKTKKGSLILLTAYWVEYSNEKVKLLKKYYSRNE